MPIFHSFATSIRPSPSKDWTAHTNLFCTISLQDCEHWQQISCATMVEFRSMDVEITNTKELMSKGKQQLRKCVSITTWLQMCWLCGNRGKNKN